jgi:hypothetical protein
VVIPRNNHRIKASWLFNSLKINQYKFIHGIDYVNGQHCYRSASKIKNKLGVSELQIIVSFNKPNEAQLLSKERWQIESAFRVLKSSGFNIEDAHLTDIDRINKLFTILLEAFVWAKKNGNLLELSLPYQNQITWKKS